MQETAGKYSCHIYEIQTTDPQFPLQLGAL